VAKLASIGTHGMYPMHCHRDLAHRRLAKPKIMTALGSIPMWIRRPPLRVAHVKQQIMLPHHVFASLYEQRQVFTQRMLGGSAENVPAFWEAMRAHPALIGHAMCGRTDYQRHAIPVSLHGDGVPVTAIGKAWGRSVQAYSWSSMLAQGPTTSCNFLIFFIYKSLACKSDDRDTVGDFWKTLCYSLNWLFQGSWPLRDVNGEEFHPDSIDYKMRGKRLAGPYYCTVWTLRADLEYLANELGLPHPSSHQPCALCRANTSDIPWTDHRERAAWAATIWGSAHWAATHPERHPLFKVPGVSICNVYPDLLHVKHLGTDSYFCGSTLQYLTHTMLADTPERNLEAIFHEVKTYYKASRVPKTSVNRRRMVWIAFLQGPSPSLSPLPHPRHWLLVGVVCRRLLCVCCVWLALVVCIVWHADSCVWVVCLRLLLLADYRGTRSVREEDQALFVDRDRDLDRDRSKESHGIV